MDDLPSNYTYYTDEKSSDCIYIKEITNENEAMVSLSHTLLNVACNLYKFSVIIRIA